MIKINKEDSIIDILIKIKNCSDKNIILDFPFGHPILHNYTSLKILKNKALKKELIIITSDKTAKKIGKRLGIKYSKIGDSDLLEYNYTFIEYSAYIFKRYIKEIAGFFSLKTPDIIFEYQKKHSAKNSKIGLFIIGLFISIVLLIFIFYFAVSKTYIYITPEIVIKTKAENFIFKEFNENEIVNKKDIPLNKISKLVYITNTFGTSGVNEKTLSKSKGKAIFYNKLNEEVKLLQNTRVQANNGIEFTTDTAVFIPKATYSSSGIIIPGETSINITSKVHDINGKIAGSKANIGTGELLTIPGLKTNKDKIYAKSPLGTKGGNEKFKRMLTKEDIENGKKILLSKLKQESLNQLKKQIKEDNKSNNITLKILGIDNILEYSNFTITGEDKLIIGDTIDKFELSGTIKITSYTYNTQKVLNRLSNTIKNTVLPDIEKLLLVDPESLRLSQTIYKKKNPDEIKATAQVEALFSHNFLNKKNTFIYKLKNNILGKSKDEAIKILLNNPNISDVKIEIRPFFINTISKINDNIIIKVVK